MSEQAPELKPLQLTPEINVTKVLDAHSLEKLRLFLEKETEVGWDLETTPLKDYFYRRIRTMQFGNQKEQYVVDLLALVDGDSDLLYNMQGYYGTKLPKDKSLLNLFFEIVTPVLCNRDILKIGVNLAFEYMCCYWCLGLRTQGFYDCMVAEKQIWAGAHSMKDYSYYSMEEMMARYFGVQIDKTLQESFNLEDHLTDEQYKYAALDTRLPMPIRKVQKLILEGWTYKQLVEKNHIYAKHLKSLNTLLTGDNLVEIVGIENDAIGAFQDMHIHGERIDRKKWADRITLKVEELKKLVSEELDPVFLPIVGSKHLNVTDEEITKAEENWKSYRNITDQEIELKTAIRKEKDILSKNPNIELLKAIEDDRKKEKEKYKKICSELKKKKTKISKIAAACEGEALINYASGSQLLGVFAGMKGLKTLTNTEDDTLEKFNHIPVIKTLQKYRELSKEIGTYGMQWCTEWKTHPCKDEGWLHPGDGRLHCVFNQCDAATGRSTSEKPNGQNLPIVTEVRSCFLADPPNEDIRISNCCEADTVEKFNNGNGAYVCQKCFSICETHAEEYVIVTADMSGAELRILAELAKEQVWIDAFNRGEDVHAVCTEIMHAEKWPKLAVEGCAYFKLNEKGEPQRQKCKCPQHSELRNETKVPNFLLPYGGSERALAVQIKKPVSVAREILNLHKSKFPTLWKYLENSGAKARMLKKTFDMFGRRRIAVEPNWDSATELCKEIKEERLRLPLEEAQKNLETFIAARNRRPNKDEAWILKHRNPNPKEVGQTIQMMMGSIEREGKNHCIQATNATIAKKAMGAGYDKEGKPYLWHLLPLYRAHLVKFVHDELVIQCPKQYGKKIAELVGDAFKRAAAEKMKLVVMEFDYNIAAYWKK